MTLKEVRERLALEKKGIEALIKNDKLLLKKRRADKEYGEKQLASLHASLRTELSKHVTNIRLISQVRDAIEGTEALLEGIDEVIESLVKNLANFTEALESYTDLDAAAEKVIREKTKAEPNIERGRVIPFDKQRST